jgi:DNA-directed RNA polymerase specialized sigma24 family protein
MNALDHRLHAWLVEPDERRFELAFNAYFAVAFPAVVRYLARISHWDSLRLEDLAQEALLRFFDRVGRARREASRCVVSALARLRPLRLGPFHERQVQAWVAEVSRFAEQAMGFRTLPGEIESKAAIQELLDRIALLQRQGEQLLRGVQQDPGAESFGSDVGLVVSSLPTLRVPTNSYLFQIARSIYLDECKKHGRLKRGGVALELRQDGDATAASPHPHPLESLDAANDFASGSDDTLLNAQATRSMAPREPAVDPTQDYEREDFFGKFHQYLRAPLERAAEAYRDASATGSAVAERRKLESLTSKFTRTVSVIAAIGEGHTQEQVAEQLGLSRNQVKYILELVQEAYAQFVTKTTGSPPAPPAQREQSHVP